MDPPIGDWKGLNVMDGESAAWLDDTVAAHASAQKGKLQENATAQKGKLQENATAAAPPSLLQASGSLSWLLGDGGTAAPTTAVAAPSIFGYAPRLPPGKNPADIEDVLLASAMLQEERSTAQPSPPRPGEDEDGREELERRAEDLEDRVEDIQGTLLGALDGLERELRVLRDKDREIGVPPPSFLSIRGSAGLLRNVTKAETDLRTAEDLLHKTKEALRSS